MYNLHYGQYLCRLIPQFFPLSGIVFVYFAVTVHHQNIFRVIFLSGFCVIEATCFKNLTIDQHEFIVHDVVAAINMSRHTIFLKIEEKAATSLTLTFVQHHLHVNTMLIRVH